jgi:hypothetical protein
VGVPSYRPNKEFIQAYQTARHNRQWVVKMNDGTKYKTVETVSSVRAGFMRGRGSIAWVVVPFDSNKAKEGPEVCRPRFPMASPLLIAFPIQGFCS